MSRQIVTQADIDAPQQPQEWTVKDEYRLIINGTEYYVPVGAKQIFNAHNAALATERLRFLKSEATSAELNDKLMEQLAAAIDAARLEQAHDDRKHYEAQRKPLVDAIKAHQRLACCDSYDMLTDALARVKESK